ncbi:MAG: type I DNA topoisomerase, partial [Firmicutes bacterium]|nr:type I DNA topoisomerase [Bacillota bacterium]
LQQDASIKLNFTPKKTMMLAQELYEGVNIKGRGTLGLISYIRTDSVRISDVADAACKAFIKEQYSEEYLGNNYYSNKKKGAQDAHEAIRPSYVDLTPDDIKESLSADQYKLYRLIWSRFVASRMKPAVYDAVNVDVINGDYTFKASGRKLAFDGYLKVYNDADAKEKMLPALDEGQELRAVSLSSEQKFTEPPTRFTEASLIKELEDKGIGRPSTYAPIVTNLLDRRYIYREKKTLAPTELGMRITREIMEVYFKELVDANFTADMEEKLDKVEEGIESWQNVVGDYYHGYMENQLTVAEKELQKLEMAPQLTDELCPECGKPLAIKHGRFGDFLACSAFPACRFTKTIITGTGVMCPDCGKEIIEKRSRKGKLFYGCSGYPQCSNVYWYKPVDKRCPKCQSLLVARGRNLQCSNPECGYHEKKGTEKE